MRSGYLFLFVAMLTISCHGETFIVDLSGNGDYPTIQNAIDATLDGDTVLVRDGIYTGEGNRDVTLLRKAITVKSENGPENCILDCQGTKTNPHRGIKLSYCWNYPVLDGFTIMNGYGPSDKNGDSVGGGIYCNKSALIIKNCVFYRNTATHGGGIRAWGSSVPYIYNCKFIENKFFDFFQSIKTRNPTRSILCF